MLYPIPRLFYVALIALAIAITVLPFGSLLAAPQSASQSAPLSASLWNSLRYLPPLQSTLVPLANIARVEAHRYHTCALTTAGGVKCWGNNENGRLGDGTLVKRPLPVDVVGLTSGVTMIEAGGQHTCVVTSAGGVKCWGQNTYGQLGNGTTSDQSTPVNVVGLSGVSAVSAGGSTSCALLNSGGVKCWGDNTYGQIGDGTTEHRLTPVDVPGLTSGVRALALGGVHSCALLESGAVKCWGDNLDGELGDGTNTERHSPVDVVGLSSGVATLAARRDHTCVLLTTGVAKCWGTNEAGQLGDGTKTSRNQPVTVTAVTANISVIIAGGLHSCVLTTSGGVKCWGANESGQLGNGTTTASLSAVDVTGLQSGVTTIATGRNHTCARLNHGGVKCWGLNSDGEIGDNTLTNRTTPVDVLTDAPQTPTPTFTPTKTATATSTPTITPTPTNTLTPQPTTQLPDLIVLAMNVELETGGSCNYTSTMLGVRVSLFNNGDVAAGPFVVAVNGQQKAVDSGLAAHAGTTLWLAASVSGQATATVDATGVVAESSETNNSLTQFLPIPTLPPTCTPTVTPTDIHTPTPTATATPPDVPFTPVTVTPTATPSNTPPGNGGTNASLLYIPIVAVHTEIRETLTPTPIPTTLPLPTWRLVGQAGLNGAGLAMHQDQLFLGDRRDSDARGLYRRALAACAAAPDFTRLPDIDSAVLGIEFSSDMGVLAAYDQGLYYSDNHGNNWKEADTRVKQPGTVALMNSGLFLAGSQNNGIYKSTDGKNWQNINGEPKQINRMRVDGNSLWIGSPQGVWHWSEGAQSPQARSGGLNTSNSKQVWDFAFRSATEIYIATFEGIYRGDGTGAWQPFGLQDKQFYSLAFVGDYLYAGARRPSDQASVEAGVWRRSLRSGDWERVTSANWNTTYIVRELRYDATCQGLVAATNDGVWLLK